MPDQPVVRRKLEAHLTTEAQLARRLVLAAVMMAIFMAAVNISIVATAMPTIVAELGGFTSSAGPLPPISWLKR